MPNWLQCDRCNHWVRDFAVACDGCGHRFPKACRHFLKNRCKYGDACRFKHVYEVGKQVDGYPKPLELPQDSLTTVEEIPYLPDPQTALADMFRMNLAYANNIVVPLGDGPIHGSNAPPYQDWGSYMCLLMRAEPQVNAVPPPAAEGPPPKRLRRTHKQPEQ